MGIGLECLVVGILEYRDVCICIYNMIPLIIRQFVDVIELYQALRHPFRHPTGPGLQQAHLNMYLGSLEIADLLNLVNQNYRPIGHCQALPVCVLQVSNPIER